MTWWKWSTTAASNASSDSTINWAEGQSPSSVNDSARAEMAANAKYFADHAGSLLTGGTATAYTLTSNGVFDTLAHMSGFGFKVRFHAANGAAATLNVDGLGAKALQAASGTALTAGVIAANSVWDVTYDNSIPAFIVTGVPATLQAGQSVALSNIASIADGTVLGNISGSSAAPSALTITGANKSGSTISFPAPPAGSFKNLSIKVTDTTHATLAADFITVTDGTSYQTLAFNQAINLGTTGAGALDTGTIAIDTWYHIWAVAKADGTASAIASTSSTAPTMPSGYTFKARVGAVQTIHASATLYGTWQFGRHAQYVVGLAQTTQLPTIISGVQGNAATPTWVAASVSRFVPPTASRITILGILASSNAVLIAAPNNSYGGDAASVSAAAPPMNIQTGTGVTETQQAVFLLESTNIYFAGNAATSGLQAMGWEDNI